MQNLKPVKAVLCPLQGYLVSISEVCEKCPNCVEIRRPWRYWAVKCSYEPPEGQHLSTQEQIRESEPKSRW